MALSILDCTIRDGGHHNGWCFHPSLVRETYMAAWQAGVSYFEVGYRHLNTQELGPFAHCTDELLAGCLPRGEGAPRVTVMVDAARGQAEALPEVNAPGCLIEVVRVASYPRDLLVAFDLVRGLLAKGYEVSLNVMAAPTLDAEAHRLLAGFARAVDLDWLCVADSFGSLLPGQVGPLVARFREAGFQRLAFHPHNNLQLAFANALAAIEAGVTMVDATAFGMGRGAGNLPMELLLAHLESQGHQGVRAAPYMNLVAQRYEPLQAELGWGYGVAPMLGGLAGLHPSAVSRSLAECGGGPGVLWETLFALGDLRHLSVQPVGDQPCVR